MSERTPIKRGVQAAEAILLLAMLVFDCVYIAQSKLLFKACASACFALLAGMHLVIAVRRGTEKKFPSAMAAGLFLSFVADIVLNLHFIAGAALFALAHLCYFASYCALFGSRAKDLLWGVGIFVPSVLFITLAPIFDFSSALMEVVCIVYALILSQMVGKALAGFFKTRNRLSGCLAVGSVLFYFSDLMLLIGKFSATGASTLKRVTGVLCLASYYPAQFFLAMSILFFVIQGRKSPTIGGDEP
jgi:uncharacterized membrane protein YhhN